MVGFLVAMVCFIARNLLVADGVTGGAGSLEKGGLVRESPSETSNVPRVSRNRCQEAAQQRGLAAKKGRSSGTLLIAATGFRFLRKAGLFLAAVAAVWELKAQSIKLQLIFTKIINNGFRIKKRPRSNLFLGLLLRPVELLFYSSLDCDKLSHF